MIQNKKQHSQWSQEYRALFDASIAEAKILGFQHTPRVSSLTKVSDQSLGEIQQFLWNDLYPILYRMLPTYWGVHCQTLSTNIFAHLIAQGIEADIVIGEVNINGTQEYDTTLEIIRDEYKNVRDEGAQTIHAWVTIGDDIVIDAGLPDRLIKYYKIPEKYVPPIIVDRASNIDNIFRSKHVPMVVGTDFIAKTNTINPLDLATHISQLRKIA